MSKPFITYTAQVEKLKNEKDLVITDDDFAVESLQNISYYALIGGYKHPFIDIHTRKYINEACFEDIVALYEFDEDVYKRQSESCWTSSFDIPINKRVASEEKISLCTILWFIRQQLPLWNTKSVFSIS